MNPNFTDPPCPAGSSCPPHPPGDFSYGNTPSVPLGAPRGSPVPHSPPGLPPYPASPSPGPGPVSMATAAGCGNRVGPRAREGAGGAPPAGSAPPPHGGSPGAEGRDRPGRRSPGWGPPGREPGRSAQLRGTGRSRSRRGREGVRGMAAAVHGASRAAASRALGEVRCCGSCRANTRSARPARGPGRQALWIRGSGRTGARCQGYTGAGWRVPGAGHRLRLHGE